MSSLHEIKERIASVRTTLKITNAMKLVAAAKLRKAERALELMTPFRDTLVSICSSLPSRYYINGLDGIAGYPEGDFVEKSPSLPQQEAAAPDLPSIGTDKEIRLQDTLPVSAPKTAIVAIAGNSSFCGAFNSNILQKLNELMAGDCAGAEIYLIGKKIAEPLRGKGFASEELNDLVGRPSYEGASALAQKLIDAYRQGVYSRVLLLYNHFVSGVKQEVKLEKFLPFVPEVPSDGLEDGHFITEPSAQEIAAHILPQMFRTEIYSALLDSITAEQAARTVAMQTAGDNASDLLEELTLEYNKSRQQQITAEILDIVGGTAR